MSSNTVTITFPNLSPAEASVLAQEMAAALADDGIPAGNITRQRASADAQDMGAVITVVAGAYLWELVQEAGKEFVKGAANRAGRRAMNFVLRKWATRAKVECAGKTPLLLGEQHSRANSQRSRAEAETLADLKTLGVVILGASAFPNYPLDKRLDNPAFTRAAALAREVFSPTHTVFRDVILLARFIHHTCAATR